MTTKPTTSIPLSTAVGEVADGASFDSRVRERGEPDLAARSIETVQINLGLACNLACRHCHVESSPSRTETMSWETIELVLEAARRARARTLDLTGGAPEMHPHFRRLLAAARAGGFEVIVRTNLTILLSEGYADLPELFRDHRVRLVASLPCYLEENVDRQRGRRVFSGSVEAIRRLNAVGYGREPHLVLDLVFNPQGPSLPPAQSALEEAYRRHLDESHGIQFTRLIAIANMPIGRFLADLRRKGEDRAYLQTLRDAFNPKTLDGLMCRYQIHVSWDGSLHDCDFNYALATGMAEGSPRHIRDFERGKLEGRRILTGEHCHGCAAGAGSSCGGAIVE